MSPPLCVGLHIREDVSSLTCDLFIDATLMPLETLCAYFVRLMITFAFTSKL